MKKKFHLLLVVIFCSFAAIAQQGNYWSLHTNADKIQTDKAVARLSFPTVFKLFNLNIEPLRQELFNVTDNRVRHSTIISLPDADGNLEQFEVFEASNFEPDLQAHFPEIRAFSGKGITDKYATLKLSISPQGIQTMVFRTDKENEFIEAYSQDHGVYAVFKSQRTKGSLPWSCSTQDRRLASDVSSQLSNTGITARSGGDLKTMRLAQSVTAEYSNYFGATSAAQVALVLAAINATLTRCNGVYEKDLAVHLNLVAASANVIYYDALTDPYDNAAAGAGGTWNAQLQSTLTSVIGEANYDIGHLFGASGGGGNAGCIGCICTNGSKGSGFTSPADGIPQGDNFDIDYVVHEVGHQMGANHTFTFQSEGGTLANSVQKEVGSGITIMGYAGITSQDVAPHSIDIYHEASIAQIQANLATKSCPVTTSISANNATPVVAAVSNYTIPISTPFALTGSATDANAGDVLTYCWEQNDATTTLTGSSSVASVTKAAGPNWISFSPTTSPTRIFPKLSTILAGLFVTPVITGGDPGTNIEALSSVSRTLNFRLTVRDNAPYSSTAPVSVGQTQFTDMAVTVTNTSGPFGVSSPNTAVSWMGLTTQTVTWTVNNTTAAPVSCANVNILLSTDGGLTWPVTLAANTPNDGSEAITVPNSPTTTARVKVEAVGNIFFDISNSDFTIVNAAPGFDFDSPAATSIACGGPVSATTTLGIVSYFSYSTPVNLSASGLPPGTTVSFSSNPVIPGNSTVVTLNNVNTLPAGTYNITITGISGSITAIRVLSFIVQPGSGPAINTQPVSQTICSGTNATFSVSAAGTVTSYQWQLSTDGGTVFNNIGGATGSSYTVNAAITSQNQYRYRVIVSGQCNSTTSGNAVLTVNATPAAPVITPAIPVTCLGNVVTLNATAVTLITGTLGSGTSTSAGSATNSTLGPNPLQNFYGGDKQQMLFRTAELTTLGLVSGTSITAIKLNLATADATLALQNLVVKMKNSSSTTMAAWESGMIPVRTAANYTPSVGLNTLTLTTPFVWTGGNLVIEINYSNGNAGTTGSTFNTAKYSATTFVSTRFYRVDNASASTVDAYTGTPSATYSQRNDVTFEYGTTTNITWSPLTDLYNEVGASTNYLGIITPTVFAKPSAAGTANYIATATSVSGCTNTSTVAITVNPLPTVSFSGLANSYCATDAAVTLTGSPAGGTFSGTGVSVNTFDPSIAGSGGPYTITYSYTNANGCTNNYSQQVNVSTCTGATTLSLKLFLEGFYTGASTMAANKYDLGMSTDPTATDDITVNLWSVSGLGNQSPGYSVTGLLHTNGTATLQFPGSVSGNSFYIAVKHRNSIETWSKNPVSFTTSTTYDFSTGLIKAYDDGTIAPMKSMGGSVYALYAGDTNQDGGIDGQDMNAIDNEIGFFGYNISDVNGDMGTDGQDMNYIDNNSQLGLFFARPY